MTKLLKFDTRNHILHYILLSTAYLQIFHFWGTAAAVNKVCTKQECKDLADSYKKIINPRGNPCNDFYDFVCHGWAAQNPRPKAIELWADHEILSQIAMSKMKKLLEDTRVSSNKKEENAKSLYKACMNLPFLERGPPDAIKKIMHTVGNWPMFVSNEVFKAQNITWQYCEEKYISIAGESSLFDYHLTPSPCGDFHITIFLHEPYSPFGMTMRRSNWNDKDERNHYKAFLMKIIRLVAPVEPKKFAKAIDKDLDDVIAFREALRNIQKPKRENIQTTKISEFQKQYDTYSTPTSAAKIDWLKMISSMYKNSIDSNGDRIGSASLIDVQLEYFWQLAAVLQNTSNRVIANHVHLYFAERHLLLTEDMESDLEKTVTNPAQRFGTVRYAPERWKTCITHMEMEDTLGRMYVNSNFPRGDQLSVTGMVVDATSILKKQISECTWLDPFLVKSWIDKLDHVQTQIGYPRWYFDDSGASEPRKLDIDPLELNVHYIPALNEIGISASYLQWPNYDANFPFVINYGSILPSIGHELYHMLYYDDLNRNIRTLNNASRQYKMHQKFEKQLQCFKEQYTLHRRQFVQKKKLKMHQFQSTTNEDVPDVMGLKLAYKGYKDRLAIENCTVLPGLEQFDCEKLFFIAFAKKYCADISLATEARLLTVDVHSLPQIRINSAVSNMKEFAQAFNCKPGDALVLKKTCDLWEL